jgi:hypothetical protein
VTAGADTAAAVLPFRVDRRVPVHPERMSHDDGPPPPASDLSSYRRARQERSSDALIQLYAAVLGQPLKRRELTPEEQARRENRLREREQRRRS